MQIFWHGQYTVKIVSKETTLILDPYSPECGLSPFRAKADILSFTNPADPSMSYISGVQGDPLIIDTPGEYSCKGFTLHAIGWGASEGAEKNLQRWVIEDMVILHVGALNRDLLPEELAELERTDIDVLLIPIGGGTGMTTKQALSAISTIEPRIVIPIHYKLPNLKEELAGVEAFAGEMGVEQIHAEKKLVIKASKLPQEDVVTTILIP